MNTGGIETLGVETVPAAQRTAAPSSIVAVFVGSNLSLSVMVFGWLTILYGLGFWQAVSAILVGTVLGSLLVSASSLLGWRAATNKSVASGAFFGVKGRLVASFVGLLLCIQYVALTVWTGGEIISSGWARISGLTESDATLSVGFLIIAAAVVAFAVFGYSLILRLNSWLTWLMIGLIIASIIGLWPSFDPAYAGDPSVYALGSLTPTWLLAALTAGVAGPISYVTQTGDWARYVSPDRNPKEIVRATFLAMVLGLTIPTIFGAFVATAAFDEQSFVAGFVAGSPTWLLAALLAVGFIGSLGQGSINLYSMGLDMDAILPRLTRVQSTALVAALSTALVFVGKFAYDAEAAVTNSVLFLTSLACAWTSIALYGYWRHRGLFDQADLQVFNRRIGGGRYWFHAGWNWRALVAWLIGSAAGIAGISSVDFTGVLAAQVGGVDLSIPASLLCALAVYAALDRRQPPVSASATS